MNELRYVLFAVSLLICLFVFMVNWAAGVAGVPSVLLSYWVAADGQTIANFRDELDSMRACIRELDAARA